MATVRVLVVDDDAAVRDSVGGMLEDLGMATRTASNARAAMDMCAGDCPFDIVLADVVMPEISGVKFAEVLRGMYPTVPVVPMTGHERRIEGALSAGVVPLYKPFTSTQLKNVIDDALEN